MSFLSLCCYIKGCKAFMIVSFDVGTFSKEDSHECFVLEACSAFKSRHTSSSRGIDVGIMLKNMLNHGHVISSGHQMKPWTNTRNPSMDLCPISSAWT